MRIELKDRSVSVKTLKDHEGNLLAYELEVLDREPTSSVVGWGRIFHTKKELIDEITKLIEAEVMP